MDRTGNMQFKLESMTNRYFWGLISLFIVLCTICLIIGGTGPTRFIREQKQAFSCSNGSEIYNPSCSGVNISADGAMWSGGPQLLTTTNQVLSVFMTIHNKQSNLNLGLSGKLNISITISGSHNINGSYQIIATSFHLKDLSCVSGQLYCNNISLVSLLYLQYSFYNVSVQFLNVPDTVKQFFGNVDFTFFYYASNYALFGLGVRYFFLIVNMLLGIYFLYRLKRFKWATEWIIEQKWTLILLLFLLLLNNPFYAINILSGAWFPNYMDSLFTMGFINIFLLFFLCIFDSLRKQRQQRSWRYFYIPKITYLGIFFLLNFISLTYIEVQSLNDPMSTRFDTPFFSGFQYFIIAYAVIYIFWILYYLIRLFKERDTIVIPNVGSRYKFITIFTVCIALATIIGTFLSVELSIFNSSIQLMAYYGIFNLYIYFLTIIYIPVKKVNVGNDGDGMMKIQGLGDVKDEN